MSSSTTRKLEPDPTYQDCWPSERYKGDEPAFEVSAWRRDNDDPLDVNLHDAEPLVTVAAPPQCPVCLHEMENDEGVLCDACQKPTGPGSFAVVNGPGGVFVYHLPCYDEVYSPEATVESCPECGAVTDIDYGPETVLLPERESGAEEETFNVPFPVQSWTFEALIETEINRLHEIIDDHHDEILEMARKRHREGFVAYGSKGYSWDAKMRLRNVLEELSDGGTYLTMGPIE